MIKINRENLIQVSPKKEDQIVELQMTNLVHASLKNSNQIASGELIGCVFSGVTFRAIRLFTKVTNKLFYNSLAN